MKFRAKNHTERTMKCIEKEVKCTDSPKIKLKKKKIEMERKRNESRDRERKQIKQFNI